MDEWSLSGTTAFKPWGSIPTSGKLFANGRRAGFTLVEMLLVVSLMAMIGVSLYQAVANGIKIWQRSQQSTVDEDVVLLLERINFDLLNAFDYSLFKLEEKENKFCIATIVTTRADSRLTKGRIDFVKQIGKVEYYFDKDKRAIFRREANYSQALKNKFAVQQLLVTSIRNARFVYFHPPPSASDPGNAGEAVLPAAVKIELEIIEPTGATRKIQRLFNIPRGTVL